LISRPPRLSVVVFPRSCPWVGTGTK
jgi:hypothetical protein